MTVKVSSDEYFEAGSIAYSIAEGKVSELGSRHIRVQKKDGRLWEWLRKLHF
ncbi:MAG: hypothetical protein NTV34_10020 [Proteobacteria bacterium]|nr:hypothetical protein [Pseudomonadota bacterium]